MRSPKYGTGFSYFKKNIKQPVPEPDVLFHWQWFETVSGKRDHLFGKDEVPLKTRVLSVRRVNYYERKVKDGLPVDGPKPRRSYREAKDRLPWCLPQGQIERRRNGAQTWKQVGQIPSGLFMGDIDVKDNRDCPAVLKAGIDPDDSSLAADEARVEVIRDSILGAQMIGDLPYLADMALSPGGLGFKCNVLVEEVGADDIVYWKTFHAHLSEEFLKITGVRIDKAVKSMWPCFFTYDPQAVLFTGAVPIELSRGKLSQARENAQKRIEDAPEMGLVDEGEVRKCLRNWIKGGCKRLDGESCLGDDGLLHHEEHRNLIWGIVHAVGSDAAADLIEELGIPDICSDSLKLAKIISEYRQDWELSAAGGADSITWQCLEHTMGIRGAALLEWFDDEGEPRNEPPRFAQAAEAARAEDEDEGGLTDFDVDDEKEESGLGGLEEADPANSKPPEDGACGKAPPKGPKAFGDVPGRPDSEFVQIQRRYWVTNKAGCEFLKPIYNLRTGDLNRILRFNLESFNEELRISAGVVSKDERKLHIHTLKKHRTIDLEAPCFHLPPGVRTVGTDGMHALNTSRTKAMLPASLSEKVFKALVKKHGPVKCDVDDTGTGDAPMRNKQREKIFNGHRVYYQPGGFTGKPFGIIKWGEKFPQIAASIEGGYGPIEQLQEGGLDPDSEAYKAIGKDYLDCQYLDRFLTFFHHWYVGALGWRPHQGLCAILVGDADAGKGWAIDFLIGEALGGVCQAEEAFAGKDQFNEADLLMGPVWALHDITANGAALNKLTSKVKHFIATNWMRLRGIRKDSATFRAPGARVCQSANYEDIENLPHGYSTVVDKLLVIELLSSLGKGWHGKQLPFPVFEAIEKELPHFLAWLLYEFRPKPELLGRRFGVQAFFRASLSQAVLDSRQENDLTPVLEELKSRVLNGQLTDWQDESGHIELGKLLGVTKRDDGLWLCLKRGAVQEFCQHYCKWMPARDIKDALRILLKTKDSILVDPRMLSGQRGKGSPVFRVWPTMEEPDMPVRDIPLSRVYAMIKLT